MKYTDMKSEENRKQYKVPGGASHQLRTKNAVFISSSNSIKHEMAKCLAGYQLRKWGDVDLPQSVLSMLQDIELVVEAYMISRKYSGKESADFITEAVPQEDLNRRVDLVDLSRNQRYEFETTMVTKQNAHTIRL